MYAFSCASHTFLAHTHTDWASIAAVEKNESEQDSDSALPPPSFDKSNNVGNGDDDDDDDMPERMRSFEEKGQVYDLIALVVKRICEMKESGTGGGAILVFLSGLAEIKK